MVRNDLTVVALCPCFPMRPNRLGQPLLRVVLECRSCALLRWLDRTEIALGELRLNLHRRLFRTSFPVLADADALRLPLPLVVDEEPPGSLPFLDLYAHARSPVPFPRLGTFTARGP